MIERSKPADHPEHSEDDANGHNDQGSMSVTLRGRKFTTAEIGIIKETVTKFEGAGRTKISLEVCAALQWTQPNGWPKDRACREVLRFLDANGVIKLPEPKRSTANFNRFTAPDFTETSVIANELNELPGGIELQLAKGNAYERQWNEMMQRHHYLGHRVTVGKCLKFIVRSGETVLGGASLAESSWAVASRDNHLLKLGISRSETANNGRFLILPEVRIRYLASRVLAALAREGPRHWEDYYSIKLRCLETYVDATRFAGVSYKAANWLCVGYTAGYRKCGSNHFNSQTQKRIFLYPLEADQRSALYRLLSEKCKEP